MIKTCEHIFKLLFLINFIIIIKIQNTKAVTDLKYCSNVPKTKVFNKVNGKIEDVILMDKFTYAVNESEKSIHCCASEHFDSIMWFFNGIPLANSSSTFRVSASDPRYIVSMQVAQTDGRDKRLDPNDLGKYTCVWNCKKDSLEIKTSTYLSIMRDFYSSINPAIVSGRHQKIFVNPGDKNVEFKFGAFFGFDQSVLPAADSYWKVPESFKLGQHYYTTRYNYTGDGGVTVYTSLVIAEIEEWMINQTRIFTCVFNNTEFSDMHGDQSTKSFGELRRFEENEYDRLKRKVLIVSLIGLFLVLIFAVLGIKFHIEIRLYIKDRCGKIEDNSGGKEGEDWHDVFVCYSAHDSSALVFETLLPVLERRLHYSCYAFERDALGGEYLPLTQTERVRHSRRLVLVLSAGLLEDALCLQLCQTAVHQAMERRLAILCVQPPRDQTNAILANAELSKALAVILSVSKRVTLPGTDATRRQLRHFWSKVRLRLPPRRTAAPPHTVVVDCPAAARHPPQA